MKKSILLSILVPIIWLGFPLSAFASLPMQTPIEPTIPMELRGYPTNNQTLFGENQYYTVTFRGNGEAVVDMKAILNNSTDTPLSAVTLHTPAGIHVDDLIAYQVIAQPQCLQPIYQPQPTTTKPSCQQYAPPTYDYVAPDTTYQKISITQKNDTIQFSLPTPIKPTESGSYLLSYRSFDYTAKNLFGAYNVLFQTVKTDDRINSLQVGITTDSDLYLKDATGTVNYTQPAAGMMAIAKSANTPIQNQQFTDFYNQIGQGTITKSASQLEPMETYSVKDTYADTGMKLYGKEIATTAGGVLLFLAIVIGIAILLLRHKRTHTNTSHLSLFFFAAGGSFASIFLASLYTLGVFAVFALLANNSYVNYTSNMILLLLIVAVSGAVYLFLIFMPTVLMLIKRGILWGCVTFGLTIMWIIIAGVLLFGIFYLFSASHTDQYPIRPLMMSAQSGAAPTVIKN